MASEVSIANGALVLIGAAKIISLADANDRARAAEQHYATSRDAVLEEYPWTFAIERVKLAKLATTPLWEYAAEYQIPPDSLRVLDTDVPEGFWKQEGSKILSNQDPVNIKYIKRVIEPSSFSSQFIDALEAHLAYKLAYSLMKDKQLSRAMYAVYQEKIEGAASTDGQTGYQDEATNSTLLDART